MDEWTIPQLWTLEEYRTRARPDCPWCGRQLPKEIQVHDHLYGWPVRGYPRLQWLVIVCHKCDYEWALWKLGVPKSSIAG